MTGRDKREPFIYLFVYFFRGHTITHEIRGTNHAVTRLLLTPDTYTETRLSKYKSSLVTVNTTITCTFTHACTTAPLCGVSCKIKTKHTQTQIALVTYDITLKVSNSLLEEAVQVLRP